MKICKDKKYAVENNVNFEFSLLMTLDMKKMRLSEFIYYSRTNRVFDIKFTNSDKWQHWKRIPPMKCPMLYERVNSYKWFLLYFIHSWIYYILCEILYFISSSILFYHWDLEKQGERWVVALERNECNVSQLSDCYQNGAFSQISLLFKILIRFFNTISIIIEWYYNRRIICPFLIFSKVNKVKVLKFSTRPFVKNSERFLQVA